MEAANRGARDAGGRTIGLSTSASPRAERPNPYITPALSFEFHYFFMRKLWFAHTASALVASRGLRHHRRDVRDPHPQQTAKLAENNIILIYGRKYWDEVLNWKALVNRGTINENEFKMLQFASTVDEAFNHIRTGLEKYHMKVDSFLQS